MVQLISCKVTKVTNGHMQNVVMRVKRPRTVKLGKNRRSFEERVRRKKTTMQLSSGSAVLPLLNDGLAQIDCSWSIESYRGPYDTNSLWNLKKWFMELHKEQIPESELVPLAQSFANVEALGCTYAPELMHRIKQLGEPIARVYHNLKSKKCIRTLVPVGEAARLQRHRISYSQHIRDMKQLQIDSIQPTFPTTRLADIFQNIVVVNNSLKETTEWFERLGGGTISVVVYHTQRGGAFEVKAFVADYFITKSAGTYEQAHSQCVADLIEILKNYCHQVNYRRRFPFLYFNVEKLSNETGKEESPSLRKSNIGYQMLQRLGWTGGPLGFKQTGIINPIHVPVKNDRRGLGCMKRTRKANSPVVPGTACEMHVAFYNELMKAVLVRKPYYDLIFSPEFTEKERIILTRLAGQLRIRCETRQWENGQAQFVIKRYPLPPHEVLLQVLIEQNPLVMKFYEVIPPKVGLIPKCTT